MSSLGGLFMMHFMGFLVFSIFLASTAVAQEVVTIAPDEAEDLAAPAPTYGSIVNQFPLEDIRNASLLSWRQGLNPKIYWTADMEKSFSSGGDPTGWLRSMANDRYLKLLMDVYTGAIDPSIVGPDIKVERRNFLTAKQLQALVIANGAKADVVVEALSSKSPPYKSLQLALEKIYPACLDGTWPQVVPSRRSLQFGRHDKVIPALKARLAFLGYQITTTDDLFDQEMLMAVTDLQWNLKFKPDGVISPRGPTMRALQVSCLDRVHQIQADMEKLRWFPMSFEDRYIFVNTSFSYFALVDKNIENPVSMSFQVINGRPTRKTPTMADRLIYVNLNPFWIVPPTVFFEDKVEDLRWLTPNQVRAYFKLHNYEAFNETFTRKLDPGLIDWWTMTPETDAKIYIRQRPHLGNALGVVKFMLTNSFSIYMHDTNQRELFREPQRLLSSGCVRLEKPIDLATYLLAGTEWTREKIEATVAKPGEVLDRDTKVYLKQSIPVYLVPLTSQMTSDGVIRFAEDSYSHNQTILYYVGGL
jgi:murein L,D-transpeptidase YcbB/YkuD